MSEVTFAKTFLATLDKRPIKLAADHVSDPRQHPNQSPYTLPRQTHPFPRRTLATGTVQSKPSNVTATIKPMRGGGEATSIAGLSLDTTIHDIKTQYASQTAQPLDKIKLLLNKKPAADLKTLKELGVDGVAVEFSAMIMGGGGAGGGNVTPVVEKSESAAAIGAVAAGAAEKMDVDPPQQPQQQPPHAPGPESEVAQAEAAGHEETASKELQTDAFWDDLKGFLAQRLRDEKEGERLAKLFRQAAN